MVLPKLHFVTQPLRNFTNAQLVEEVCKSGVKLVQLRIKDASEEYIYQEAKAVQAICKKYNATFILNDYVAIVKELNIDGVHLGKSDLSPIKARELLGNSTTIGGTANSLDDVNNLIKAKVDYIGLGPFKHTETKKNLSPILGLSGYKSIINQFKEDELPPIYAIGGIKNDDISLLMKTGVYGIALSGLIAKSHNINNTIEHINSQLS